jgi:alkylated DNA repair protein (DNA oxidative demethylase)
MHEITKRTPIGFDFSNKAADEREELASGAWLLRGRALSDEQYLLQAIDLVAASAPFRHMVTRGGFTMSVAMTNCGEVGWITDRRGYRYDPVDPETAKSWPAMPSVFSSVAKRAAEAGGFSKFEPDACLINRYEPGARMSLHQDRDEKDFGQPIVSISLGLPAVFLFGGEERSDKPRKVYLESGDIVVWGGPARLAFHGIAPLADGEHPLTGRMRFNLTFRRAL